VVGRVQELVQVLISSEGLRFTRFLVLHDVKPLVARNTVMERSGCDGKLNWSIRDNLRLLPPIRIIPINRKHMVCIILSKNVIFGICGLNL